MSALKIGSLVRFVTWESSVDLILPEGISRPDPYERLRSGSHKYEPKPKEIGIVVSGPSPIANISKLEYYEILVNGKTWWFDSHNLMEVDNQA